MPEANGLTLNVNTEADLEAAMACINVVEDPGEKHYLIKEMAPSGPPPWS